MSGGRNFSVDAKIKYCKRYVPKQHFTSLGRSQNTAREFIIAFTKHVVNMSGPFCPPPSLMEYIL